METLETTPTWIMLEVSGHGEVWRVLVASLSPVRAALCPHGSLHTAGSLWPRWHHHVHDIWGRHSGELWGKMRLSSAAVLPAAIISSHNIMFFNWPREPPATGHLCSCNWAVCKWIPLRRVKNVPKIASNRHFFNFFLRLLPRFLGFSPLLRCWPRWVLKNFDCFLSSRVFSGWTRLRTPCKNLFSSCLHFFFLAYVHSQDKSHKQFEGKIVIIPVWTFILLEKISDWKS